MALRKLERRNYGGKWWVSIKYQNLHSFKKGLILLCQSILETRRIIHLHGSAHLTIPLIFERTRNEKSKTHDATECYAIECHHLPKFRALTFLRFLIRIKQQTI